MIENRFLLYVVLYNFIKFIEFAIIAFVILSSGRSLQFGFWRSRICFDKR